MTDTDISLYSVLKKNLASIDLSDLIWQDLKMSMIISDESTLVKNLGQRQKQIFLELHENMKCDLPISVASRCDEFVNNFNKTNIPDTLRNIIHNNEWKEEVS